jgi:hypothetical protein
MLPFEIGIKDHADVAANDIADDDVDVNDDDFDQDEDTCGDHN